MTSQRPHSPSTGPNAVAWALLSQTIWLPLLAIDLHDHWQAQIREQREIAAAAAKMPTAAVQTAAAAGAKGLLSHPQPTTGVLLGSANRGLESASRIMESPAGLPSNGQAVGSDAQSSRGAMPAPATRVLSTAATTPLPISGASPRSVLQFHAPGELRTGLLTASFRRSELLGGSLTLADLQRPAMPSLAMAERARWASSSDPLAPLPTAWREPMRRAIHSLSLSAPQGGTVGISGARGVHIPSNRVSRSTPVPLAVQGDGSVDILSKADDPAVVEEIRSWSKRQAPSAGGGVTAAIVHLEPMPEAPPALIPSRPIRPTVATRQSQPSATITPLNPASATRLAPAPAPRDSVSAPVVQAAPIAAPAPVVVQSQVPAPAPAAAPEPPAAAPAAGTVATP
jgi:hypothetical protein